ncbi:hypothetical protein EYZ11_013431 [Aspergillus tanneri]|uniref:Uncharacterized protein n=1 Tax=Aspergillus tanneri TaxID=1220188 RepID=A0A4S3IXS6_9EURO|nr:hypothetical protein EYZ11_013431 [Aspergillus tanneri]
MYPSNMILGVYDNKLLRKLEDKECVAGYACILLSFAFTAISAHDCFFSQRFLFVYI